MASKGESNGCLGCLGVFVAVVVFAVVTVLYDPLDLFGFKKRERESRDFITGSSTTCLIDYNKWSVRSDDDKYERFTAMYFTNSIGSLSQYFQGLCGSRGYNVGLDSIVLIINKQTKWYFSGLRKGCNDPESDPIMDRKVNEERWRKGLIGTHKQQSWNCLNVEREIIPGLLDEVQHGYVNYVTPRLIHGIIKNIHKYDD